MRGLVINGFAGDGVELVQEGDNFILGNYIGTDVAGDSAVPNTAHGVNIVGSGINRHRRHGGRGIQRHLRQRRQRDLSRRRRRG